MKNNRILQTVKIAVFAVCTVFSLFISILACIPVSTDVEIREMIHVSAAPLGAESDTAYQIEVSGAIKNTTGQALMVDRLEIPVKADGGESLIVIEQIEIPARTTVTVSKPVIADVAYDRVGEIKAEVNGETMTLRNPAEMSPTVALIPIAVTVIFAFLLVRSCKVRYYMMQEDQWNRDHEVT